jgi:preprotein translocase subunit SecG
MKSEMFSEISYVYVILLIYIYMIFYLLIINILVFLSKAAGWKSSMTSRATVIKYKHIEKIIWRYL